MFSIVETSNPITFFREVSIVPDSWLTKQNSVRWPPSYKNLTKRIKKCEEPSDDWLEYDCKILLQSLGKL